MTDAFYGTSGPRDSQIMVVGESWGAEEAAAKAPFIGSAGQELQRIFAEVKLDWASCFKTNVVAAKPDANEMWKFFAPRDAGTPAFKGLHPYAETMRNIRNLYEQVRTIKPKLIIAVGNYALWAVTECARTSYSSESGGRVVPTGITSWRGSMVRSTGADLGPPVPVLPIIHPSSILRQWSQRSPTLHDLRTRVPLALAGDWERKSPPVFDYAPSFNQVIDFLASVISSAKSGTEIPLACDIETRKKLITCVGFATGVDYAICIPLLRKVGKGEFVSWWSVKEEMAILRLLCVVLTHPNVKLIGQNFLYDMFYFWDHWKLVPRCHSDTMLKHHLLFPGTQKDLAYLSSLYCHYHRYWKDDNKEWDEKIDMTDHLRYNCEDCIRTFEVNEALEKPIIQQNLAEQWAERMENNDLAFEMMITGFNVDKPLKLKYVTDLIFAAQERQQWLLQMLPQKFVETSKTTKSLWFSSPSQQKQVFTEIFGMKKQISRKTGTETLDEEALLKLKKTNPWATRIIDTILELRSIQVFNSTFAMAPVDVDGRLRTSFKPAGTSTFRWASGTNPTGGGTNFQNLPSGNEE
jgi:uracil-DNA glycosylase family 4